MTHLEVAEEFDDDEDEWDEEIARKTCLHNSGVVFVDLT